MCWLWLWLLLPVTIYRHFTNYAQKLKSWRTSVEFNDDKSITGKLTTTYRYNTNPQIGHIFMTTYT